MLLYVAIVLNTFSLSMLWIINQQDEAVEAVKPAVVEQIPLRQTTVTGTPARIVIPSLAIDLAILPGEYDKSTGDWTLSSRNPHYATMTAPANNQAGNTFIYGHNNRHVFSGLWRLQPGALVEVYTDKNDKFVYEYRSTWTVVPEDVSLLSYTGSPILTVQTCSGSWYQHRQLFWFSFKEVVQSTASLHVAAETQRESLIYNAALPLQSLESKQTGPVLPL